MTDTLYTFEHTEAVLREYAAAAEELYKDNLLADGRVATGELIDSVRTEVSVGGRTVAVDMHLADYWKYVEFGTEPHWPPPGALLKWIEAKPVIPRPDSRGRIPTPQQLDFLIRRKISRVGTEGKPTLSTTVAQLNEQYLPLIEQAITEDVGSWADFIVSAFGQD